MTPAYRLRVNFLSLNHQCIHFIFLSNFFNAVYCDFPLFSLAYRRISVNNVREFFKYGKNENKIKCTLDMFF